MLPQARSFARFSVSAILCVSLLSACTPADPDYNRVITPDSVAEVGPILSVEELELALAASAEAAPEPTVPSREESAPIAPEPDRVQPSEQASQAPPAPEALDPVAKPPTSPEPAAAISVPQPEPVPKPAPVMPTAPIEMPKLAELNGHVKILGKDMQALDVEGSIVSLKRKDGRAIESGVAQSRAHDIGMKDKVYTPRYLNIRASDQVSFINQDEIKHNVFSSTGNNAFDLGTYGAGKQRSVALNAEGVVKVYCNIHSEMATFIRVDTTGISTISEAGSGAFSFSGLEPGDYVLTVWHVRGEQSMELTLQEKENKSILIEVDTSLFQSATHANKFGQKYKKNTALFDDEFY